LSWQEAAKRAAALEAVKHVRDGQVLGLGSGSTVVYSFREIARRIREEKLRVIGVPTSSRTASLATELGIPLTTLDEHPRLDLAVDGTDQVDMALNLIKGMGGALTREKIVDSVADQLIIVADETKLTRRLGLNQSVPVEVLPFAVTTVLDRLSRLGARAAIRCTKGGERTLTDNGNHIIDADLGPIDNPEALNVRLRMIPGVIETGLFLGMTDIAYIGLKNGTVEKLEKSRA
jgi:ribose 5-phosphate isomerase A